MPKIYQEETRENYALQLLKSPVPLFRSSINRPRELIQSLEEIYGSL